MKSFHEFHETGDAEELDEGLRSGSIGVFAARSKAAGDKAQRAFQNARSELRKDMSAKSIEDRIGRLESVIDSMCAGFVYQRDQLGFLVSLVVSASLLKERSKRKR